MTDELPAFALYEEHEALREAVRALADDKIAPRAAEIDRTSEFPWDVYEELFGAPEHKLGIKGSPTRELYFDDCEIPASRLIGAEGEGFKTALRTLDHTRITIAAQALGIAQGALDYALGYVKERKQFGRGRRLPGPAVHDRRHGHEARGGAPAHLRGGGQVGPGDGRGACR